MPRLPAAFCIALISAPSLAAEPVTYSGPSECRIVMFKPEPARGVMRWAGPCRDGFAEGKGELKWSDASGLSYRLEATLERGQVVGEGTLTSAEGSYIGTLQDGKPHGAGYIKSPKDGLYEGGFVNGKRHGQGIAIWVDRSRLEGEWRDGKLNGFGRATFTMGGAYEGEWKDGKFHGKGIITYAGSGHKHEGQFINDKVAGTGGDRPAESKERFNMSNQRRTHDAAPYMPPDATWAQITAEKKYFYKAGFPALEEGDEPPYPVDGTRALFNVILEAAGYFGRTVGELRLYVLVGPDGRAISATTIGSPRPEVTQVAATAAMAQRYKPAVCRGQPCAMVYPLRFVFTQEE